MAEERLILSNYKAPLKAIPEDQGFGYFGALRTSEKGTYVQCHMCGNLFQNLGNHIGQKHGISPREYKAKFQLALSTSLTSEVEREKRKNMGLNNWKKAPLSFRKKFMSLGRAGKKGFQLNRGKVTLETRNKRGNCPEQLIEMIRAITNRIGHRPTILEFKEETKLLGSGGMIDTVYTTFGSWARAVELAGYDRPISRGKPRKFNRYELIEFLKEFHKRENKIPTNSDCGRGFLPDENQYYRYFGGIKNAREIAGITT